MIFGFGLSTTAGLMTLIGAVSVYFPILKDRMRLWSCFCLATASGVMAYVSLVEVFGEAKVNFTESFSSSEKAETRGLVYATTSFFVGWTIGVFMDFLLHKYAPTDGDECKISQLDEEAKAVPIDPGNEEAVAQFKFEQDTFRLVRVGWFTALALTIHNIPEGMLTYVSALSTNPTIGIGIACAIGLHNIPEGFAVAFPIMLGTGSKRKAMIYAGITGFAEPLGALFGYFIFGDDSSASAENKRMFGWLFGVTAGIMTEVAIKSLLIESVRYDPSDRIVSKAWIFGAAVIAISLVVIDMTASDDACGDTDPSSLAEALAKTSCTEEDLGMLCPFFQTT
jgi:ZIP family zinc transporter